MSEGLSFEQALARLEEVVRLLESGDLGLEESLSRFQEGMGLVRLCAAKLEEAERRIDVLVEREDGRPALEPLALEVDEEGA